MKNSKNQPPSPEGQQEQITIPAEGVWFDREDKPNGEHTRTYWRDGQTVLVLKRSRVTLYADRYGQPCEVQQPGPHNQQLEFWVVGIVWRRGEQQHSHQFDPIPIAAHLVARALVDAVGIGIETAQPARHISEAPRG